MDVVLSLFAFCFGYLLKSLILIQDTPDSVHEELKAELVQVMQRRQTLQREVDFASCLSQRNVLVTH
jgi:hypothetical protein